MAETWKFFVIDITYLIPTEQMSEITPLHRAFLQAGYKNGWLLLSGPQVPRTGGMIIGRAPSREALEEFFSNDPYLLNKVATYRFVEFNPIFRQDFLEEWITEPVK
jgi:uncharacterized protein YciI